MMLKRTINYQQLAWGGKFARLHQICTKSNGESVVISMLA